MSDRISHGGIGPHADPDARPRVIPDRRATDESKQLPAMLAAFPSTVGTSASSTRAAHEVPVKAVAVSAERLMRKNWRRTVTKFSDVRTQGVQRRNAAE